MKETGTLNFYMRRSFDFANAMIAYWLKVDE